MRKIAFALPLIMLVGSAGAALAVDVDAGTVRKLDNASGSVTLIDGRTFKISNPSLLMGLIPGEKVIITVNDDQTVGLSEDSSQWDGSGQLPGH
ncbi:DUF1344 domain-containing protein [Kaistia soli]|uniref:DUF1344 domain-containing protein n=1 Tax=Kaistia soli TaxID=446684 RepID=UPI0009338940|nr:DUF1344 domain-containing protein [Kaistia soli]